MTSGPVVGLSLTALCTSGDSWEETGKKSSLVVFDQYL